MADPPLSERLKSDSPAGERRLESWGEIASYLRREIRTVQRWETFHGLPVHRLVVGKLGSVYAYPSELDRWRREREPKETESEEPAKGTNGETPVAERVAVAPAPAQTQNSPDHVKPSPKLRWMIVLSGLLIFAGAVTSIFLKPSLRFSANQKTRLFVRPFTNSGHNAAQDEFIAGLTEETITQLGKMDPAHLGVIAPTSSELLASRPIDELGRTLHVQYVLQGGVSRNGNQVRIDAQLYSVSDQTQIWSESYNDDLSDILRVQDNVSRSVAEQIHAKIPGVVKDLPKGAATKRVNPEAYDAYLKGRLYWANRDWTKRFGFTEFQQALQKDPDYAPARTGLASSYLLLGQVPNDAMTPAESVSKARPAAQAALAVDPKNADAHCVLANIAASYDWDFAAAEREYHLAIGLDPNNSTAREWYGHYLIIRNRIPEAQAETSLALDLDPVSPIFNSARAETFYYARDYDASIDQARRTVEQYPNTPNTIYARIWLASAYREKKQYPEALQEFEQLRQLAGDNPAVLMLYGHAQAVSGNNAEAQKVLTKLHTLAQTRYVPAIYFAVLHAGLGEKDSAFTWFDKALKERDDRMIYLGVDPLVDPIRSDDRFRKLLNRIGVQ
jgi:TolB-like protein/Tfp pilus assembly protein PilF